jgi:undecaprenyl diphosphate synthase
VRATAGGRRLQLRLAIDYSARWAIGAAAQEIAHLVASGDLRPDAITPETLNDQMTNGVPELDLIIRTAGEQRLSDFMLWEAAYAELYFTPILWPDFRREDLALALSEFGRRERRFGGVDTGDAAAHKLAAR